MECQRTWYGVQDLFRESSPLPHFNGQGQTNKQYLRDLNREPHGTSYLGRDCEGCQGQENVCLQYPGNGTAKQPEEAGHREPRLVLIHHHTSSFRLPGGSDGSGVLSGKRE